MNFKINKDSLLNGLRIVEKATAVRGIQPILSNVLIETFKDNFIKLSATDLDITIQVKVEADIENIGNITLPAKKLVEIVSKLPNSDIDFSLNSENNITTIKCKNSKFDIIGLPASEFPEIIQPESDESIDIDIEPFAKAIKQTGFATATYDSSNILSGIFCKIEGETLEMAATDGNRLSRVVEPIENKDNNEFSVVIPSRTLNEFTRIFTASDFKKVAITIKSGQICFEAPDKFITSRTLEGQYPKYQQLIPQNQEMKAVINRDDFINSLERTATMVNERTSILKLEFEENSLKLSANTPDLGDSFDKMSVEFDSDELKIAFNYKYILDCLKVIESEDIVIEMNGSLSAAVIKPNNDEDYLCLIMPVQIK